MTILQRAWNRVMAPAFQPGTPLWRTWLKTPPPGIPLAQLTFTVTDEIAISPYWRAAFIATPGSQLTLEFNPAAIWEAHIASPWDRAAVVYHDPVPALQAQIEAQAAEIARLQALLRDRPAE